MSSLRRRVHVSRLAPTGEGISRGEHGVGFVVGALPGEDVVVEVQEIRRSFWRGRTIEVLAPSRDRVLSPEQACPGCDWGHFETSAAREAKRALFLETMHRIGKISPGAFGDLPIAPSPRGYRIRNRFHLSGRGADLVLGQFAARTHRVEDVGSCRAIGEQTSRYLPEVRDALAATGAAISELSTLENPAGETRLARAVLADGPKRPMRSDAEAVSRALAPFFAGVKVVDPAGAHLRETGDARLEIRTGDRPFLVSVETFFQGNRYLAGRLQGDVEKGSGGPPADALDAFGGVGFFASALLSAGHNVASVEGNRSAARDAAMSRMRWPDADRWKIVPSSVSGFLAASPTRFEVVVADPPRAGLAGIAGPLAARARRRFLYVSCDPATLARDLPEVLAQGFEIADAQLYDLFALTHRVEAIVTLTRGARGTA